MRHSQTIESQRQNLAKSKRKITHHIWRNHNKNYQLTFHQKEWRLEDNEIMYLKCLKKRKCQRGILFPKSWGRKMKYRHPQKNKDRKCITSRPVLQEILKLVLKVVRRWHQVVTQIHRKKWRHGKCKHVG